PFMRPSSHRSLFGQYRTANIPMLRQVLTLCRRRGPWHPDAVRVEPVTEDVLVDRVVDLVLGFRRGDRATVPDGAVRLLVDGHPSTHPEALADRLVAPLRAAGRPVARVRVQDFWRPASLRLERGREDADALLDEWVDVASLNREVLDAVGPGGTGRYLPSL